MQLSDNYDDFRRKLDRIVPRYGETAEFDFSEFDRVNGL